MTTDISGPTTVRHQPDRPAIGGAASLRKPPGKYALMGMCHPVMESVLTLDLKPKIFFLSAGLLAALTVPGAAAVSDWDACKGRISTGTPLQIQIESCTRLISAPSTPPADAALARYNRAKAHMQLKRTNEALEDFRAAAEADKTNATLSFEYANALLRQRQFAEAIDIYGVAIATDPKFLPAYVNRGLAQIAQYDHEAAAESFTRAIALLPDEAALYRMRGQTLSRTLDASKAIGDFSKALSLDPRDWFALKRRAEAYLGQGETDLAIADYRKLTTLRPEDASIWETLCRTGGLHAMADEPTASHCQTLADKGGEPGYRNWALGLIKLRTGNNKGALAELDQLISRDPENRPFYYFRAIARERLGDRLGATFDYSFAGINPGVVGAAFAGVFSEQTGAQIGFIEHRRKTSSLSGRLDGKSVCVGPGQKADIELLRKKVEPAFTIQLVGSAAEAQKRLLSDACDVWAAPVADLVKFKFGNAAARPYLLMWKTADEF